ncbi:MAG TPA: pyridoxamine 5'-phosphate oxidase family protein [Nocardioides sp.]|uniref:pyridoxamine 5'-phosphate oxidase family protein n=1 Tax=uncultured Nocardioides sp. TaxID=198441 RepID=UPI000EE66040|nr:pyridoxamine 5'-phosphate oxidase family protein [uncultured Nocardioides sp.]HCB06132.1 pyridoxamine 5'-phosphate oxidase [Nocardioides sp.]HRD61499.1 pyridoxamine 5'-phosphate oxidase family protein [Nocardioides sp.]HRI95144.1 pyridoxamine 5'-phosphate oxidase family protein [Nocardioides sp.]HRK45240.1 pyridoxamine 5'-phosphate oxidase family protein [Nocardioides sp.]
MTSGTVSPLYGDSSADAPAWAEIDRRLAEAQLYWIVTVRRDGRPHAVPLCGVWREGTFFFCTGDAEQKMRNLEHDPHVVVTAGPLGAAGWGSGKDIAVEGVATRVADEALLRSLADEWSRKYDGDWEWEVRDGRFFELSDQGDGTRDGAVVFRVPPDKVLVFGDEHGQTTYRF